MHIPRTKCWAITLFLLSSTVLAEPTPGPLSEPDAPKSVTPITDASASSMNVHDTLISARDFRAEHPAPENLDDLLAVVAKANHYLLKKARRGYSSYVTLAFSDHKTAYGRDYVFSAPHHKLREIRAGYDDIATEANNCLRETRSKDWPRWHCEPSSFSIGLEMVVPDAIISWESEDFVCEIGWCRVYRFVQSHTGEDRGVTVISSNPSKNYTIYSLFLRGDGMPIMLGEEGHGTEVIGRDWIVASYVYDFKTRVPPFSLPYAGKASKSPH